MHSLRISPDTGNRSSTGHYGLRRNTVATKQLRDYLDVMSASKSRTSKRKPTVFSKQVLNSRLDHTYSCISKSSSKTLFSQKIPPQDDSHTPAEPRNPGATFISSFDTKTAERRKRELKEPLEERYIANAAVIPDLRPLLTTAPASAPQTSSSGELLTKESPLLIHGHSVKEYQSIYHSVVDPMLSTRSARSRPCSQELGRRIKQRLWEVCRCPTLRVEVQPDGQLSVTETFSTPTPKSFAPHIEVDISGEPRPEKTKRRMH